MSISELLALKIKAPTTNLLDIMGDDGEFVEPANYDLLGK